MSESQNNWRDFLFKNYQHFEPILRDAFARHLDQLQQAQKELDEEQLFKVFCEALVSGDFIKQVTTNGAQNFIYMPFTEAHRLRTGKQSLIDHLIDRANCAADNMEGADGNEFLQFETRMICAIETLEYLGVKYDPITGTRTPMFTSSPSDEAAKTNTP